MASNSGILEFDAFRLDTGQRTLERIETGEAVRLTPRPLDALCLLVDRPGEIVSKQELMQRLWPHVVVEESNLTQTIYVLRQALGEGTSRSRFIVTEPGRGYRFVCPVRWLPTSAPEKAPGLDATTEPAPETRRSAEAGRALPSPAPAWRVFAARQWLRWSVLAVILGVLAGVLLRRT